MEFVEERQDGIVILEPIGRVDNASSPELQKKATELIEGGGRRLVLDLVRVESIGGAGLRVLLMLAKKLESMGGSLVLCSMSDPIRKAVDMAGFARLLSVTGSRADAVTRARMDEQEALKRRAAEEEVAKISDLAADLLAVAEKRDASPDEGS